MERIINTFKMFFKYKNVIKVKNLDFIDNIKYNKKIRLYIIDSVDVLDNERKIINLLFMQRKLNIDIIIVPKYKMRFWSLYIGIRELASNIIYKNDYSIHYLYFKH